ncbi:MAG: hypothetical protein IJL37_07385 [Bacteroidaceae bacterium]|nr:hypothetical protein [Bacteroidaceae bacterium]
MKNTYIICTFLACLLLLGSCKEKSMKMNDPHNIRGVVSYNREFNDLNETQLKVAQAIGIPIIADREAAEHMKKKLTEITDCEAYTIDSLTHSIPFLIPGAAKLLETIGRNFNDSLASKGLNPNRIIVTSVLRTQHDVNRLRKSNGNASENSTHMYGTTFDISWKRFLKTEKVKGHPMESVSADTLKMVLSEVLRDLKKSGECYVKHERNQGCFHITTRKG